MSVQGSYVRKGHLDQNQPGGPPAGLHLEGNFLWYSRGHKAGLHL